MQTEQKEEKSGREESDGENSEKHEPRGDDQMILITSRRKKKGEKEREEGKMKIRDRNQKQNVRVMVKRKADLRPWE